MKANRTFLEGPRSLPPVMKMNLTRCFEARFGRIYYDLWWPAFSERSTMTQFGFEIPLVLGNVQLTRHLLEGELDTTVHEM